MSPSWPSLGEGVRRALLASLVTKGEEPLEALVRGVDLEALLALAVEYLLVEPLSEALLGLQKEALPSGFRGRLWDLAAAAAARNGLLLNDLVQAQRALGEAGVASVALKGMALLAGGHYPSIAARHLSDVDLLVGPRELARAAEVLAAAGLTPAPAALPTQDGRTDALGRNPAEAHLRPLAAWSGGLLELHDRLPGGGPPAEEVIGAAQRRSFHGGTVVLAAPGDLAGMLSRHVLLAHAADARLRARHVADLVALERTGLSWSHVRARYGARLVEGSLALLSAARREAAGEGRASFRLGLLEPFRPTLRARMRGLLGGRGFSFLALWRAAFPSRRYMEARYGLLPGAPLSALFLTYPRRLLKGAFRLLVGR